MNHLALEDVRRASLERAVAEWQRPIYNLAYRLLGNEADAADATQEVFLTVVRKWHRYDPSRPLRPWLFQVALNGIRNFHRGAAARARRERGALAVRGDQGHTPGGDVLEESDRTRRIQAALARLPPLERALIVLHYYSGLSHGEMGEAMSLPRTTVQSRLGRALERLRGALAGLGWVAPCCAIEAAMRATAPLEVPAALSASLSALPAATVAAAAALPTTIGGLIMTKKLFAATAAVAACLALAGGAYTTGKRSARSESERALADGAAALTAASQREKDLKEERRTLSREVETLRSRLEEQTRALARTVPAIAAASPEPGGEAGETAGGAADGTAAIDWSRLSGLFAERLDLIYELQEAGKDRQPSKEERKLMAEMESVLQAALSRARQISDNPFYDARVLLGMCNALCTPALGLDEDQEKGMRAALADLFSERVEGFDPDAALPAEAYRVRQGFLAGMDEAVSGSLDEAQAERWRKINVLARKLLEGDRDRVAMPLAPEGGAEAREAAVLKQWGKAFTLAEGQSALIRPLASEFLSGADAVLGRYGQLEAAPRELPAAEKARMQAEIMDLQIQAEKQVLRHLTPEQVQALRGRAPIILQFAPGNNNSSDRRRGSPL